MSSMVSEVQGRIQNMWNLEKLWTSFRHWKRSSGKNSPNLVMPELSENFSVHRTTVRRRLEGLFLPENWIVFYISLLQINGTSKSRPSLLFRYKNECFLTKIFTGNENWVMYCSLKYRWTAYWPSELYASVSKSKLLAKKILLNVW